MLDRRTFTFATLLAAAGPAAAAAPSQLVPAPDGAFAGTWKVTRKGDKLRITLTVHNRSDRAADVQVQWGHQPGAAVLAYAEGAELTRVLTDVERRDVMSRVGPRPVFAAVPAGQSVELAPYLFQLADPDTVEVVVTATVETDRGSVALAEQVLRLDGAEPAT